MHVAVVEDDDMVGDILKTILEQHDFDVTVVTNISTALQIPGVDLFVCDVHLPDGTGVALARQLLARMPDCRLILMSGSTAVVEVEELTLQGGQEIPILRKPFLLSQFLEQIYNLCGKPAKSETGRQVY